MKPFEHSFVTSASPSAVFNAITTQQGFAAWWCRDCDIGEAVGDAVDMRFDKQGTLVAMHFEIERLSEPAEVAWRCTKNDNPVWKGSTLTWSIEASPKGAKVSFCHDGFADGGPPYEATMQGWAMFMKSFETYLGGGTGTPF